MSITLVSSGAFVNVFNANVTPVAGTYQTGDALIYSTGEFIGSDDITTPAGWTLLSKNSVVKQVKVFGKIAASTSETIPSVFWSSTAFAWGQITAFRGVDSSFTSAGGQGERSFNSTIAIAGPSSSLTPNQANALGLFIGGRNKTTTTNGMTYSAPTNWTIANQFASNGANNSAVVGYWIQTTATATAANMAYSASITEGTTQSGESTVLFLAPAPPPSGGGGTGTTLFPPSKRKTYVFYDMYYPR